MTNHPTLASAWLLLAALFCGATPSLAGGIDDVTDRPFNPMSKYKVGQPGSQGKQQQPVELRIKAPALDELIVRTGVPSAFMQPIPLRGVKINGLYPKSVELLGSTYFVVVDNSNYTRMSDIYRDSRLAGKSNFVTADSITHPYLAFSNRILAEAVVSSMVPDLRTLLEAMQKVQVGDYKSAEDADVRKDIQLNIAYLAVALKFLNPSYEIPRIGTVPELVEDETKLILAGQTAPSVIFEGVQDYSVFKPLGWYNSSKELQNFYRSREWLSLVPFPINESGGFNMFRRSVLLFRSLDQANILGKPAADTWLKLVRGYNLLGSHLEAWGQRTLYAQDYKSVFQEKSADLHLTMHALAEPFFRTKLMLALRNQKPMNLGSASIFELGGSDAAESMPVFRLFPMVGQPEVPWLRGVARFYPEDKTRTETWPLSLIDMYAMGSPEAGNVLSDNLTLLDPNIARVLPALQHCVTQRLPSGQLVPIENRVWTIMSQYFRPMTPGTPAVTQTELWLSQRLISSYGGWVDAISSISPSEEVPTGTPTGKMPSTAMNPNELDAVLQHPSAGSNTSGAPGSAAPTDERTAEGVGPAPPDANQAMPRRVSKVAPFHYLEPNLEIYRNLRIDATRMQTDLDALKYFPIRYRAKLNDFIRLFQRLEKICAAEIQGGMVSVVDRRLLGDIDKILSKVDMPLGAVLSFDAGKDEKTGTTRGFNMAVGRPGELFIIYQNPHSMEWTLGRGAVYTYYEVPTPLLTDGMWQHKVEAGFAVPPSWSGRFELVQKAVPKSPAVVNPPGNRTN